jgi:hypothetical protein
MHSHDVCVKPQDLVASKLLHQACASHYGQRNRRQFINVVSADSEEALFRLSARAGAHDGDAQNVGLVARLSCGALRGARRSSSIQRYTPAHRCRRDAPQQAACPRQIAKHQRHADRPHAHGANMCTWMAPAVAPIFKYAGGRSRCAPWEHASTHVRGDALQPSDRPPRWPRGQGHLSTATRCINEHCWMSTALPGTHVGRKAAPTTVLSVPTVLKKPAHKQCHSSK